MMMYLGVGLFAFNMLETQPLHYGNPHLPPSPHFSLKGK